MEVCVVGRKWQEKVEEDGRQWQRYGCEWHKSEACCERFVDGARRSIKGRS